MKIKKYIIIAILFCNISFLFCWSWPVSHSDTLQDIFISSFEPRDKDKTASYYISIKTDNSNGCEKIYYSCLREATYQITKFQQEYIQVKVVDIVNKQKIKFIFNKMLTITNRFTAKSKEIVAHVTHYTQQTEINVKRGYDAQFLNYFNRL